MSETNEIQAQIIQTGGNLVLLPNGLVVEILRQAQPTPIEGSPEWLMGTFPWQNFNVPLVSLSRLMGKGIVDEGHKCVVVKALGENSAIPCFALHMSEFPQFVAITRASLLLDTSNDKHIPGVRITVFVGGKSVIIPDLDSIEDHLVDWII